MDGRLSVRRSDEEVKAQSLNCETEQLSFDLRDGTVFLLEADKAASVLMSLAGAAPLWTCDNLEQRTYLRIEFISLFCIKHVITVVLVHLCVDLSPGTSSFLPLTLTLSGYYIPGL